MQQMNWKNKLSHLIAVVLISAVAVSTVACSTARSSQTSPATTETTVTETSAQKEASASVLDGLSQADTTLSLVGYGAKGALADEDLTVLDMLTYAIQDEYLAHGEYAAIIKAFGSINPYANIIRSEESHIAYLNKLFLAYDMAVPQDDSSNHVIVPADLLAAAKTGVQAEIDNIAMYKKFLDKALPLDVHDVFSALKNASESHLKAFEKQVDKLSGSK